MALHKSDVISILSFIAGVGGFAGALLLQTVAQVQTQLHPCVAGTVCAPPPTPVWATVTSIIIGALGIGAGSILRVLTNKTGAPALSIPENVKIVPNGTTVLTPETPVVAENVTSIIPTTTNPKIGRN
jgi:hypothetical protein